MNKIALLLSFCILVLPLRGGEVDVERVLVPVRTFSPVPGAHGSLWNSSLLVRSNSSETIMLHGLVRNFGPPSVAVPPMATLVAEPGGRDYQPGAILRVERDHAKDLSFSLRVQDISRQAQTWGTEIPVVRETELDGRPLVLLGVPMADRFRTTLRIYDIASQQEAIVRLRIYGIRPTDIEVSHAIPDELLREINVSLAAPAPGNAESTPGYAEIPDLASLLPAHDYDLLALEVTRITPGILPWAFVAVVNNETQHLTLLTPQ